MLPLGPLAFRARFQLPNRSDAAGHAITDVPGRSGPSQRAAGKQGERDCAGSAETQLLIFFVSVTIEAEYSCNPH